MIKKKINTIARMQKKKSFKRTNPDLCDSQKTKVIDVLNRNIYILLILSVLIFCLLGFLLFKLNDLSVVSIEGNSSSVLGTGNDANNEIPDSNIDVFDASFSNEMVDFSNTKLTKTKSIVSSQAQDRVDTQNLNVVYKFNEPTFSPQGDYSTVVMDDLENIAEDEGYPLIPVKGASILLPIGYAVSSVDVVPKNLVSLSGKHNLSFATQDVPLLSETDLASLGFEVKDVVENPDLYSKSSFYPEKAYSEYSISIQRGYTFLNLNLYPLQYNPVTGEVNYYNEIEITINLENTNQVPYTFRGTEYDKQVIENKRLASLFDSKDYQGDISTAIKEITLQEDEIKLDVLSSYEDIILDVPFNDPEGGYNPDGDAGSDGGAYAPFDGGTRDSCEYLIITTQDFASAFQVLADYKSTRVQDPLSSCVFTVQEIYSNPDYSCTGYWNLEDGCGSQNQFNDNSARIRNFIRYAYDQLQTKYVLLGGDADADVVGGETQEVIVPVRYLFPTGASSAREIASDIYFSNLDGSFDADGDKVFGEDATELDLDSEVYVGRVPADSVLEVNNFVEKIIFNELNPINAKPLMAGEYLGFGGPAQYATGAMEQIRLGTSADGYTTIGFYPTFDPNLLPVLYDSSEYTWEYLELLNLMNNQVNIINHLGHANNTNVMRLNNNFVDNSLFNQNPIFIYSQGCYPGGFDNLNSSLNTIADDSIAEHLLFLSSPRGSVAVMMNNRYGWGSRNSINGPSHWFARWFWDAQFNPLVLDKSVASLNSYSHEQNNYRILDGSSIAKFVYFETNLLGDPELKLNISNQYSQNLNIQLINNSGSSSFDIDANISNLEINQNYTYTLDMGYFENYGIVWVSDLVIEGNFSPTADNYLLNLNSIKYLDLLHAGFSEGYYIFKLTISDGDNLSSASTTLNYITKQILNPSGTLFSGDQLIVEGSVFVGENYYYQTSIPATKLYFEGENKWLLHQVGNSKRVSKFNDDFELIYFKDINVNSDWVNKDFSFDGEFWWVLDNASKNIYKYDFNFNYLGINYSIASQLASPISIFKKDDVWFVMDEITQSIFEFDSNWNYLQANHNLGVGIYDIFWDGTNWFGLQGRNVYKFNSNWNQMMIYNLPVQIKNVTKSIFNDGANWWVSSSYNSDIFKLNADFNISNFVPFTVEYKTENLNSDWASTNIILLENMAPINSSNLFLFDSTDLSEGKYIFRFVYEVDGVNVYDNISNYYTYIKPMEITAPLSSGLYSTNSDIKIYGSIYPNDYSELTISYKKSTESEWINTNTVYGDLNYHRQINIELGSVPFTVLNNSDFFDFKVSLTNNSGVVFEKIISSIKFDSRLKPNYPLNLTVPTYLNGNLLAGRIPFLINSDLDNDGNQELVTIVENVLFAYSVDGELLPGFSITLGSQLSRLAIGNIDSDPEKEIIVINDIQRTNTTATNIFLSAYNFNGSVVSGFPKTKNQFNYYLGDEFLFLQGCSLILNDIDNDGIDEIIFGAYSEDNLENSRVFVYEGNGSLKWTYMFEDRLIPSAYTMIASGDIDCDGVNEIVATGNSTFAYILNGNGGLKSKFILAPVSGSEILPTTIPPKLVNIDLDCKKEIFLASRGGTNVGGIFILAYDVNGVMDWYEGPIRNSNVYFILTGVPHYIYDFAIQQLPADMNFFNIILYKNYLYSSGSDVNLTVVNSSTHEIQVYYDDNSGNGYRDLESLIEINVPGNSIFVKGEATPILIDLTGDGISEYVVNVGVKKSNSNSNGDLQKIYAFDMQGNSIFEFPLSFPNSSNWPYSNPTVIADLDSDGLLEVAIIAPGNYIKMLYVWDLNIPKYNIEWGNYQQNPAMTGLAKDMTFGPMVTIPVANPAAGNYASAQSVTLSTTTNDANIYYTLDGSEPTQVSTRYTSAISISTTTTLKAKAYKTGMSPSNVLIATYTIGTQTQVATPVAAPAAGNYTSAQSITLSTTTSGASIYYTTNGTIPTTSSTLYSSAISISTTTTLKAIAVKSGMNNSAVMTALYTITIPGTVATPVAAPAAGSYTSAQNVTLSTTTSGASIYYTTNGTIPTTSSTLYSSAISISTTTTLKAIAVKSGMNNSAVMTALYTITIPGTVATPVAAPAAGNYTSAQSITLSTTTSGASIYYTTNGTTPTTSSTLYTSAISILTTTTLKAIAVKSGMNNSALMTASYTITIPGTVATPVASPAAGNYTSAQSVTLSTTTSDANIYYTLDGNEPTQVSTLYTSAISISTTTTLKAKAYKSGMNASNTLVADYNIYQSQVTTPIATPSAGTYTSAQTISFSFVSQDTNIYYTLDGSEPTDSSTRYTSAIVISTTTTLKAKAYRPGYLPSNTFTSTYAINIDDGGSGDNGGDSGGSSGGGSGGSSNPVSTVVIDLIGGTYTSSQTISLSTTTSGASIYYTLDGTTPSTSSSLYTSPITIDRTCTLKAIAVKSGYLPSSLASEAYTINNPTIIDLINPTPSHSSGSRVSKVHETEDSVSYQVTSITSESSDIPINLLGVSLSNLKIFSKEITDANVSVIKDITQEDYNLLYIDKIYSVFNLNISNQEKITYVSYDFIVDRSWLTENKVGARDMVAYTISNDRESVLKIKYLGDSQQGSTYNLTVAPIDGKIIIGSQTQEYKDILKSKKTVGYIILIAIILVLIFIILLIIRIMKHKTEGLEEKPKEIFDVIKNTPSIENKEQTKNQDKKIEIK